MSVSNKEIRDEAKAIQELLNSSFQPTEKTLTALALVLVHECARQGVSKKSFFQLLRDEWRSATTARDNMIAQLERDRKQLAGELEQGGGDLNATTSESEPDDQH